MKHLIIPSIIMFLMIAVDGFAQNAITNQRNGYRDGDKLYRVVVNNASPGNRGDDCVWKLPSPRNDDEIFKQIIYLKGDSLTIAEGNLLLHYIANEKELAMRGFQNRNIFSVQDKHLTELRYPFIYGDSIADTYSRKTTYFDMYSIEGEGTCYTVCDGRGVLTDGHETLKDVLRVHHHNTIVSKYSPTDGDNAAPVVSEVTEDKYLWYYPGCRYPVMDTRIVNCKTNGKMVSDTTFTSLYLPELQISELPYDDANSQFMAQREPKYPSYGQNCNDHDDVEEFPVRMSASLQASSIEVTLDYSITAETNAAFYAYDLSGRLLGQLTHATLKEGERHETMILSNRPLNSIVMLKMVAGNKQRVVKVR